MNSTLENINTKLVDIISTAKNTLATAGVHPAEREAIWLMEFVLNKQVTNFEINITVNQKNEFLKLIKKRATRYPLQYLIGKVDFFDTEICVNENVLIPRPETEEMVEMAYNLLKNIPGEIACADLGTGSGCIPIALAKRLRDTTWFACDVSDSALKTAGDNAKRNSVSKQIKFFHGKWFDAMPANQQFDFIITNPPYVEKEEKLQPELDYEPISALLSGKDGLDDYRIIISNLRERLKPDGIFLGEFGDGQSAALIEITRDQNFNNIEIIKDLSKKDRFIKILL